MSAAINQQVSASDNERALRLASARKKLQTFRATRNTTNTTIIAQPTSVSFPPSTSSNPTKMMPLTTETSMNWQPSPSPPPSPKGKGKEVPPPTVTRPLNGGGHRHRRSENQAHRRQRSSIALPADVVGSSSSHTLARPSVMGVFDVQPPRDIITTPATPLLDSPSIPMNDADDEQDTEHEQVAARLSTFSFGSKPAMSTFPPKRRQQVMLPSQSLFSHDSGFSSSSPLSSPTSSHSAPNLHRLSTPSSRPPSLLLTRPTPMQFTSPTKGPPRGSLSASPSSPPTPARKRHSHTRSNSISLPNLKLAGPRPTSLGVPTSPSYPSSPSSPVSIGEGPAKSRLSSPINGQRLKFEPSGRGAEAEKEKEESRRKALEKLTGRPPSPFASEPMVSEISLPDLDDEDSSSVASSNRPLSGAFGSQSDFVFGRPSSLTFQPLSATSTPSSLSASPFSWSSPAEEQSPVERWSGSGFGLPKDHSKDPTLTFGMDLGKMAVKRPSLARQLSALAEVDESEEEGAEDQGYQPSIETIEEEAALDQPFPAVEPTPNRLRELRLSTSASTSSPKQTDQSQDGIHSFSFPRPSHSSGSQSPTKGYGAIGRGRPNPLVNATPSPAGMISTPKSSVSAGRRRAPPGSGSRGSSISYKREDSASTSNSSRDMSMSITNSNGSRILTSPTLMSPPSSTGSPSFSGWGNVNRNNQRPCPRPRTLVGLGIDSAGSGRVLGEVDEEEELDVAPESRWASPPLDTGTLVGFGSQDGGRTSSELSRDSFEQGPHWRDTQLELEMERDALREDVEMWKQRYHTMEDRLDAEKKETAVLRDRVRKLGDRLSSVSSVPTQRSSSDKQAAESRIIVEMREQLFNLTTSLEQERRAKDVALLKLADLQRVAPNPNRSDVEESEDDEVILTARPDAGSLSHFQPIIVPSPVVNSTSRSATPGTVQEGEVIHGDDPNLFRMKGWGFPSSTPSPTSLLGSKSRNKRESFFGLSNALRRSSHVEAESAHTGVDLPPFVIKTPEPDNENPTRSATLSTQPYVPLSQSQSPPSQRAVSEPVVGISTFTTAIVQQRSTSSSSVLSPSAAMSFFSEYLPIHQNQNQKERVGDTSKKYMPRLISKEEQRVPHSKPGSIGKLDFSYGCQCCVGQLIEL